MFPRGGIGKRKIAFEREVFGLHSSEIWPPEVVLGWRKLRLKSQIFPKNRQKSPSKPTCHTKNALCDDLPDGDLLSNLTIMFRLPHLGRLIHIFCRHNTRLQLQPLPKSAVYLHSWAKHLRGDVCRFITLDDGHHLSHIRLSTVLCPLCHGRRTGRRRIWKARTEPTIWTYSDNQQATAKEIVRAQSANKVWVKQLSVSPFIFVL